MAAQQYYQVKMVVNDIYIEYTTSDRSAMDRFIGDKEITTSSSQEPTLLENLKKAFKGNSEWE